MIELYKIYNYNFYLLILIFYLNSGILLGTLIDELIYRIKDVEDMPAEIAKHLVKILNVIKNGAFGIFMVKIKIFFYIYQISNNV